MIKGTGVQGCPAIAVGDVGICSSGYQSKYILCGCAFYVAADDDSSMKRSHAFFAVSVVGAGCCPGLQKQVQSFRVTGPCGVEQRGVAVPVCSVDVSPSVYHSFQMPEFMLADRICQLVFASDHWPDFLPDGVSSFSAVAWVHLFFGP